MTRAHYHPSRGWKKWRQEKNRTGHVFASCLVIHAITSSRSPACFCRSFSVGCKCSGRSPRPPHALPGLQAHLVQRQLGRDTAVSGHRQYTSWPTSSTRSSRRLLHSPNLGILPAYSEECLWDDSAQLSSQASTCQRIHIFVSQGAPQLPLCSPCHGDCSLLRLLPTCNQPINYHINCSCRFNSHSFQQVLFGFHQKTTLLSLYAKCWLVDI